MKAHLPDLPVIVYSTLHNTVDDNTKSNPYKAPDPDRKRSSESEDESGCKKKLKTESNCTSHHTTSSQKLSNAKPTNFKVGRSTPIASDLKSEVAEDKFTTALETKAVKMKLEIASIDSILKGRYIFNNSTTRTHTLESK